MKEKTEIMKKFTKIAKQKALGDIRNEFQFTFISNGEGIKCGIYGSYLSVINIYGNHKDYEFLNKSLLKEIKAEENEK